MEPNHRYDMEGIYRPVKIDPPQLMDLWTAFKRLPEEKDLAPHAAYCEKEVVILKNF